MQRPAAGCSLATAEPPCCADMRKQANRINFNQAEEEFLDGDETVGLGVLGAKGQVLHCCFVLILLAFVDLSQSLHC